jgi:hypothetical protein
MSKRYVLLVADSDVSESERKELAAILEARHGRVKLVAIEGNPRAVIVKTTEDIARLIRNPGEGLTVRGKRLVSVLTSGAVGKLKRRASEAPTNGQVHE